MILVRLLAAAGLAVALLASAPASARDEIRIVGSSTVFPFATRCRGAVRQDFRASHAGYRVHGLGRRPEAVLRRHRRGAS